MGTKVAPKFATLVMGYLEEQLEYRLNLKYAPEVSKYFQEKWHRFLDDCYILWNNTIPVETLWQELNSIHPKIQFTMEYSDKELPFIDVLVKLHNGKIRTDIYFKPTDKHLYLNFKSCHPRHCKVNIPFCLASRVLPMWAIKNNKKLDSISWKII